MKVLGCRISDDDGSIQIEWYEQSEQRSEGGMVYQATITREGMEQWKEVGYYAMELVQDIEELARWYMRHSSGFMPGNKGDIDE